MKKTSCFYIVVLLMIPLVVKTQTNHFDINGEFSTSTNINSANQTPFWFWANQKDQIQRTSEFIQTGFFDLSTRYQLGEKVAVNAGTLLTGSLGADNFWRATELNAGIQIGKIKLRGGTYSDPVFFNGLTSSNGNLLNSGNARPYPKAGIQSDGFIPVWKGKFSVAGSWEEGMLVDERVVDKPRLHHKSLFLKLGKPEKGEFVAGIDHYVFWGGTSQVTGPEPTEFADYLRAILAMKGGKDHNVSDQMNAAGNSLGQYFLIFRKTGDKADKEVRIVHPFEDKSGMVFFNGIDNLYGFYLTWKRPMILQHLALEFIYTKNQSGDDRRTPDGQYIHTNGHDNYLNHGFYSSGFTNYGMVMGSPFFYPVILDENGVSHGIENTRFVLFHVGAGGSISEKLSWKSKMSFSSNTGMYDAEYSPERKQFSGYFDMEYNAPEIRTYVKSAVGVDSGSNINRGETKTTAGFFISLGKKF